MKIKVLVVVVIVVNETVIKDLVCNDHGRELLFLSIGVRLGANFGVDSGIEDFIISRGAQHESCSLGCK